jgi:hypothetical protein
VPSVVFYSFDYKVNAYGRLPPSFYSLYPFFEVGIAGFTGWEKVIRVFQTVFQT